MKYIVERIQYVINGNSHRGYSWELIVCDNNSTDKTADIATELGCRVGTANFQGTKFRSKYCLDTGCYSLMQILIHVLNYLLKR